MLCFFQPEIQIIDKLTEPIWYIVTLNSSIGDQDIRNVTCDQSEGTCSVLFPLLEAADYTVSISAMNIVGGSDITIYPNEICTLNILHVIAHMHTHF